MNKIRRLWAIAAIVLISLELLGGAVVMAATYNYTLTVVETAGTTRVAAPLMFTANNTAHVTQGYMVNGLDSAVTLGLSLPRMVADNKTLFVYDVSGNSSSTGAYSIGVSPTPMSIITGLGGYVTTPDSPNLEGSGNFSLSMPAYVGNTANFSWKDNALLLTGDTGGNVTANITGTFLSSQLQADFAAYETGVGNVSRVGQYLSSVAGGTFTSASFYLTSDGGAGSPRTANVTIRKASDDSLLGILGAIAINTLPDQSIGGVPAWFTVITNPVSSTIKQDVRIQVEAWPDLVNVWRKNSDVAYGNASYYNGINNNNGSADTSLEYTLISQVVVTANSAVGTIVTVNLTNANNLLSFYIDGVLKDSIYGASMNNSASDWKWLEGVPYADNITYSVNGTRQLYYAPNDVVLGTDLPDRSSDATNNPGIITWGTNPANVSVTLAGMTVSDTAQLGVATSGAALGGLFDSNPIMPVTMYTELGTSNIPAGEGVDEMLGIAGLTGPARALWWFPFVFFGACIIGMLVYEATGRGGTEGDLKIMAITIECILLLCGIVGVTESKSLIPLFPSFLFPISATAIVMSRKHAGWG